MKKYVLNIERLHSGYTANALVLNQVDEPMPVLLPSAPKNESILDWFQHCKDIHPEFSLNSGEMVELFYNKIHKDSDDPQKRQQYESALNGVIQLVDQFNERVLEFNLQLQQDFKDKGHDELYWMDDTKTIHPDGNNLAIEKTYMHSLNGRDVDDTLNSSQLNVLFPYKKLSRKSLYANQLSIEPATHMDDILEYAQGITLSGNVSYQKCLQGIAFSGNNMYVMSPCLEVGSGMLESGNTLFGNGMTIVNGTDNIAPSTMTLFQPSQGEYSSAIESFVDWYAKHNHMTIVTQTENYGDNVSYLTCHGKGSYEIQLATYSPTNLVFSESSDRENLGLNEDEFRLVRGGDYKADGHFYWKRKYYLKGGEGFLFNLYDGFISGNAKVVRMTIPQSSDANELKLRFNWRTIGTENLPIGTELEAHVWVNDKEFSDGEPVEYCIDDAILTSHQLDIKVIMHYQVDFSRRTYEQQYVEALKNAGVLIGYLWVDDGSDWSDNGSQLLTFGSYVNEPGITEEEHDERYEQFWTVSHFQNDIPYQTIVESSLKNIATNGIEYPNNYSSGDMYGDMFLTKSVLGPEYDMVVSGNRSDGFLTAKSRKYIGIGNCSNQVYLTYRNATLNMKLDSESGEDSTSMQEWQPTKQDGTQPNYQLVETIKNINRFESSLKHKSNVFSIVVQHTNLPFTESDYEDGELNELGKMKERLQNSVTQFVRNVCNDIVPVHTQLFDVQFT